MGRQTSEGIPLQANTRADVHASSSQCALSPRISAVNSRTRQLTPPREPGRRHTHSSHLRQRLVKRRVHESSGGLRDVCLYHAYTPAHQVGRESESRGIQRGRREPLRRRVTQGGLLSPASFL